MLGRFLEISIHAPAIRESLSFYESLGFVQAEVGETWPHPYAVVTDGRLYLGLHGAPIRSPALTFVLPDLAHGVDKLRASGIVFDEEQLSADVFNRAAFRDPNGYHVNVLEARTFSPPQLTAPIITTCGYFAELGLPTKDLEQERTFWESLGFVALEEQPQPFARTAVTSDLLNVALYRTRALRQPVLTFEHSDMQQRLARLRDRGFSVSDEMPDSLDDASNGVLTAPEGTRLLLLQSED
jgi:catechol 2,3-dioxygenase-like lactoylglutathione lyase family enzyme